MFFMPQAFILEITHIYFAIVNITLFHRALNTRVNVKLADLCSQRNLNNHHYVPDIIIHVQ